MERRRKIERVKLSPRLKRRFEAGDLPVDEPADVAAALRSIPLAAKEEFQLLTTATADREWPDPVLVRLAELAITHHITRSVQRLLWQETEARWLARSLDFAKRDKLVADLTGGGTGWMPHVTRIRRMIASG